MPDHPWVLVLTVCVVFTVVVLLQGMGVWP